MREKQSGNILKGAVAGLIGGLVASFVMNEYQELVTKISESQPKPEKKKAKKKSEDEPATVKAAEAISETVIDHRLTKSEKPVAGNAVHYAMGAASGLMYGVAAEMSLAATVGGGVTFGSTVWLIADDIVIPALGLSKPMTAYPLSQHAYALTSHWVYGLTTEFVRRAVRRLL